MKWINSKDEMPKCKQKNRWGAKSPAKVFLKLADGDVLEGFYIPKTNQMRETHHCFYTQPRDRGPHREYIGVTHWAYR